MYCGGRVVTPCIFKADVVNPLKPKCVFLMRFIKKKLKVNSNCNYYYFNLVNRIKRLKAAKYSHNDREDNDTRKHNFIRLMWCITLI